LIIRVYLCPSVVPFLFIGLVLGATRDRMFITTAGGRDGSNTADGAVFEIGAAHPGLPEFESRIRI